MKLKDEVTSNDWSTVVDRLSCPVLAGGPGETARTILLGLVGSEHLSSLHLLRSPYTVAAVEELARQVVAATEPQSETDTAVWAWSPVIDWEAGGEKCHRKVN